MLVLMVAACGGPTTSSHVHPSHVHLVGGGSYSSQAAGGSVHPPNWGKPAPAQVQKRFSSVPTASMFDDINVHYIPSNPFALAGYTSGYWPTFSTFRKTFPKAHTLSIAINSSQRAECLDTEPGDASPSQVVGWIRAEFKAGYTKPCVYSSYWEFVDQIRPLLNQAGISRNSIFEWDADYTYTAHIDTGFDATQWTDKAYGRSLDQSEVNYSVLTKAQIPYSFPKPKPVLPLCYHHRISAKACTTVKAKVASDNRAAFFSRRALNNVDANSRSLHCVKPYRRGQCIRDGRAHNLFAQRVRYFSGQAAYLIKTH
jgi:hypothetical protein